MSEKRRDSKNRVLRTGESQRKDGRYLYKYVDADGKTQSVYSWKLVATDKVPTGNGIALPCATRSGRSGKALRTASAQQGGK